jgi:hypothetical protein
VNRRLTANYLALVILGLGVFTFAYSLWIVFRTHSPTLYQDQWSIAFLLRQYDGRIPWEAIWQRHNEHRIPITQIACYIDLIYFGGSNAFLLSLIWISQIAHWFLFVLAVHRWGPKSLAFLGTLAGFGLYAFFSPIQLDNLIWGFQVQFIQVGLFASLASFCLIVFWRRADSKWLAAALGAALLAELSFSSGMLIWPILLLLAIGMRLSKRDFAWIIGTAAVAMGVYFRGYTEDANHGSLLGNLARLHDFGQFLLNYFVFSWNPHEATGRRWAVPWELLTIGLAGWALFEAGRAVIRGLDRSRPLDAFCFALLFFSLGTAMLTAAGRISFGVFLSFESRYQTIALLFWVAVATLGLQRLRPKIAWVQAALVVLLIAGTFRFPRLEAEADARQQAALLAYDTMAKGHFDDSDRIWWVYPNTEAAASTYQYLAAHHLAAPIAVPPHEYPALPAEPQKRDKFCIGSFDFLYPPSGERKQWIANGWAWDVVHASIPDRVAIRYEDGSMAAVAQLGLPRADVVRLLPEVSLGDTGWRALIPERDGRPEKLKVFAFRADLQTECLVGERAMTRPPQ